MEIIAPIATILSGITAGIIIVSDDNRLRLAMLALQYICVTILVSLSLPIHIAIIKLAAGWLACIMLGVTSRQMGWHTGIGSLPTGWVFRMIAVLLVSTSAIGFGQISIFETIGIQDVNASSTILLIGLGMLQLGLTEEPIGIGMGLLVILSGFEIMYSSLEPSLAILALLASIHLGIALTVTIISLDVKKAMDVETSE